MNNAAGDAENAALTAVGHARAAEREGRAADALAGYDAALGMLAGSENASLIAMILRRKGNVHLHRGETPEAEALYRESLARCEAGCNASGLASALNCLAGVVQRRGDLEEAEKLYHRAAQVAADAGESRLAGIVEQNLGILA